MMLYFERMISMNNEDKILTMLENLTTTVGNLTTTVEQVQADVNDLKQGQTELRNDLSNLTTLVHGVIHHQNEDYALLQALDRKVDRLASMSQTHEERFQKLRTI